MRSFALDGSIIVDIYQEKKQGLPEVGVNADLIERMGPKSCALKGGREVLLSRASAKEIRKAYQGCLFSRVVDRMDR